MGQSMRRGMGRFCQGQVILPQNGQSSIAQLKCSDGELSLLLRLGQLCEHTDLALIA